MVDPNVLYGLHPVEQALQNPERVVDKVLLSSASRSPALIALAKLCRRLRIPCWWVAKQGLQRLAPGQVHQGVVALLAAKPYVSSSLIIEQAKQSASALLVVVDSVNDPRNLGAVIRTAAAVGAQGLFLARTGTVGLTAAVAKAAAGALEHLLVACPRNMTSVLKQLKAQGVLLFALEAGADLPYFRADLTKPLAVVLGGEHQGIRPHIRRECIQSLSLPMPGPVASLNVSVAAAVFLYEALRQRLAAAPGSGSGCRTASA